MESLFVASLISLTTMDDVLTDATDAVAVATPAAAIVIAPPVADAVPTALLALMAILKRDV